MKPDERQEFGEDGEDLLRMLQEELAESDREVMALALDLERRLELRHTAMLDAQAEFSRTSSELLRMAMQLEDRVNERNQEVVALRDDLERRVAERTARALVTSRAKVAFLANLSHEIRTPLSAILGFAQLLARGPELGSRQRDFVDNINRAGEHLLGIVNSSLELLKIETGHARAAQGAVHLEQMLRDLDRTYRPLALAKGLEWRQEAGGAPEHFRADPTRLREVLENLLGNAFKFTDRGHVILRVRAVGKQPEPVRLVFEVEDSGPGLVRLLAQGAL